jgi:hypothetical protein
VFAVCLGASSRLWKRIIRGVTGRQAKERGGTVMVFFAMCASCVMYQEEKAVACRLAG